MKTIAIDFDGVIHQYSKGWHNGKVYDPPVPGAKQAMRRLVQAGYNIVIFTTRLNPMFDAKNAKEGRNPESDIRNWLVEHGFVLTKHYHQLTATKPPAIVYIDDRAIRFTNWPDISKLFV